jgi:hypothetical protein
MYAKLLYGMKSKIKISWAMKFVLLTLFFLTVPLSVFAAPTGDTTTTPTTPSTTPQTQPTNTQPKSTKPSNQTGAKAGTGLSSGPTEGQAGGFVPCGNSVDDPCTVAHLFKAFKVIVNYLIVMAGFVAVLAIVYAGFLLVTAAGRPDQLAAGKKRLAGAVIGMLIVAAAFVLVNALFDGSLSVGVCNGEKILTDPKGYIQGINNCN